MVVDAVIAIGDDDRLNMIGIKKVNAYAFKIILSIDFVLSFQKLKYFLKLCFLFCVTDFPPSYFSFIKFSNIILGGFLEFAYDDLWH